MAGRFRNTPKLRLLTRTVSRSYPVGCLRRLARCVQYSTCRRVPTYMEASHEYLRRLVYAGETSAGHGRRRLAIYTSTVQIAAAGPFAPIGARTRRSRTLPTSSRCAPLVPSGANWCLPRSSSRVCTSCALWRHSRLDLAALADDDNALDAGVPSELGEISVTLSPVVIMGHGEMNARAREVVLASDKVHERSKKAGVHRVQWVTAAAGHVNGLVLTIVAQAGCLTHRATS
jgi:hypothetical protein